MIEESEWTHTWIQLNTKAGLEATGVAAVVILCFNRGKADGSGSKDASKDSPVKEPEKSESRVALWFGRRKDQPKGSFDFLTPSVPVEVADGSDARRIPCLYGEVSATMVRLAKVAQARLKAELGAKPAYGRLYRVAEKVEARG